MLSQEQQAWLNKLSDTDAVRIAPYDPRAREVFQQQAAALREVLGAEAVILHKGASAWGISGKGDVDIYIPVAAEQFDATVEQLKPLLGEPASRYPLRRVRWRRLAHDIEVEIFVANQSAAFYQDSLLFWGHVETHPATLAAYEQVKAEAAGLSTRAYYTRKAIFITKIVQSIRAG